MAAQTFNPTDLSQSAANWAVAQRIVGPFAPHAQVSPDLTIALDPGYLLNGITLTEVKAQVVGPFVPPTSGFRIDRVVVDRLTGTASAVTGTPNSLQPPAIPNGMLPVARVFSDEKTQAIENRAIIDERALFDTAPATSTPVICRASLAGIDQTGVAPNTSTLVNLVIQPSPSEDINIGNALNPTNHRFQPSVAGYYALHGQIAMLMTTGSFLQLNINKNGLGATMALVIATTNGHYYVPASTVVYMNGTSDYVEMLAHHSKSSTSAIAGQQFATHFTAHRIG